METKHSGLNPAAIGNDQKPQQKAIEPLENIPVDQVEQNELQPNDNPPQISEQKTEEVPVNEPKPVINPLPENQNSFQANLFSTLSKLKPQENLIISPLSAYQVLSMTANGAKNETLKEMIQTLSDTDLVLLNQMNKYIIGKSKNFQCCKLANSIMSTFVPLEEFKKSNIFFDAEIEKLESLEKINEWCNKQTKGNIPKILDELPPNCEMVLLNAVYFKDDWKNQFDENDTVEKDFHSYDKTTKIISMMANELTYPYFEKEGMQVVELDYENDNMSAIVILPPKEQDINQFVEGLNQKKISEITNGLKEAKVNLTLPVFKLNFSGALNDALKEMGMKKAFDKGADFSGMAEGKDLKISEVVQKTLIEINETGTKAVACSGCEVVLECAKLASPDAKIMLVDRPFLFFIRNKNLAEHVQMIFMCKVENLKE
ncbi:MAG: serpin family protein [archaeon]|nr:serpin family protein [archaeon]